MSRSYCALFLVMFNFSAGVRADDAQDGTVDTAIENSLVFIQAEGREWIEQRECVSCHQVPFMLWSLNSAAEQGFSVDAEQLQKWNDWAADWNNFSAPKNRGELKQDAELTNNVDILYQSVLGGSARAARANPTEAFLTSLASAQQENGSWKAGGQLPLQKRPQPETHDVTTMWSLYTLATSRPNEVWMPLRSAAEPILSRSTEPKSTEALAIRLLLMDQLGEKAAANQARSMLVKHQQSDGGWGWLIDEPSDALGTGVALYALAKTARTHDSSSIEQAQQYLLRTQQGDGSWAVRSTKEAKRDRVEATSTYWGTCWAVIGLLAAREQ